MCFCICSDSGMIGADVCLISRHYLKIPKMPAKLSSEGSKVSDEAAPVRRQTPGFVAFVPTVAGLILASQVVRDLMEHAGNTEETGAGKAYE